MRGYSFVSEAERMSLFPHLHMRPGGEAPGLMLIGVF